MFCNCDPLDLDELAGQLGISPSTVRYRLRVIHARLAQSPELRLAVGLEPGSQIVPKRQRLSKPEPPVITWREGGPAGGSPLVGDPLHG